MKCGPTESVINKSGLWGPEEPEDWVTGMDDEVVNLTRSYPILSWEFPLPNPIE